MNTLQEQIAAAEAAIQSGNYTEAEQLIHQIKLHPLFNTELHLCGRVELLAAELSNKRGEHLLALDYAHSAYQYMSGIDNPKLLARVLRILAFATFQTGDYKQSLLFSKQALDAFTLLQDIKNIVAVVNNIGLIHYRLCEYTEALEHYRSALATAEKEGLTIETADAQSNIAAVYKDIADYPLALEYYQHALATYQEHSIQQGISRVLSNKALIYQELGDFSTALAYMQQSLAIDEELGAKDAIAIDIGNIGVLYANMGDYTRSLEYFNKALAVNKELGRKHSIALAYGNIGLLYYYLQEFSLALEYLNMALQLHTELGNKISIAIVTRNIGPIYYALDEPQRTIECYQQSLQLHQEIGDKDGIANLISALGTVYSKPEGGVYEPKQAEELLLQAISMLEELGLTKQLYETHQMLAEMYEYQERWKEQAHHIKRFHELYKEVHNQETQKQAQKFTYERQIALMNKEQEITEKLLHKTFPSPIIQKLKNGEAIMVEHYHSASILFADLVGFTKLSMQISPSAMIDILNVVFTFFDTIIAEHGGHRLRTMGDGYFAVVGTPDRHPDHAARLARAAISMQRNLRLPQHIQELLPVNTSFQIRIGLNSGPVVAGIVGGLEKWQYDVYGDAVNTASRMESHGEPGKIHISEDFKNALADFDEFTFVAREPMYIKGKGMMNTYFLQ